MFKKIMKRRKTDIVDVDTPTPHKYETVFSRDYIIGQIEIEKISKKNIIKYIHDECKQLFDTEDYYYGYVYENNILKYVAHKSNKHEVGKVSVLAIVLLNKGKYHISEDNNFYIFENTGSEIFDKIDFKDNDYDEQNSDSLGTNLQEIKLGDVPATLVFKWSLEKSNINILAILSVIFAVVLIVNLNASKSYKQLSAKAEVIKQQYLSLQNEKKVDPLIDISDFVKKVVTIIDGKAIITKIMSDNTKIMVSLQFKNEYDAQNFIKVNGGDYENGKVVFTAIFSDSK
jgi:hypothetical protein